ncbi:MAG: hypothetical protein RQM90_08730 [Methanoculleus sp.]
MLARPQKPAISLLLARDTPSERGRGKDPRAPGRWLNISPEYNGVSMACPSPSRGIYITYLIQALTLLSAAYSLTIGEHFLGFSAGIAFLLTMAPTLVTRNTRLCLPWEVNLLIILSLYLHVMGHVGDYYVLFAPYYDKLDALHLIGHHRHPRLLCGNPRRAARRYPADQPGGAHLHRDAHAGGRSNVGDR